MQQYQDFHDTPVSFTFTFEMINSTVYRQLILFWPFGDRERDHQKHECHMLLLHLADSNQSHVVLSCVSCHRI